MSARGRAGRVERRPRKRLGQHFLAPTWASKVVEAIDPRAGDAFLEIGPGPGALTLPLAATGAPILAVEIDKHLAADLARRVPPNVTVFVGDILKTDVIPLLGGLLPQQPATYRRADPSNLRTAEPSNLRPLEPANPRTFDPSTPRPLEPSEIPLPRLRVVGNLPYYITSPILFRLVQLHRAHGVFHDATVMVQREVANRLVARPRTKDYGVLTILVSVHARVTRLLDLPRGAFVPSPKVESSVVRLSFGPPPIRLPDEKLFERLVKAMFSHRRKTLLNALKPFTRSAAAVLDSAGIDGRRRPETLQLTEIARLAELFASANRPPVL
jgi:16S rRNA (adenine1518-N6/adenine1519-N6)-dimethyltransferase